MSVKKRKDSMLRNTPDQPGGTERLGVARAGVELGGHGGQGGTRVVRAGV